MLSFFGNLLALSFHFLPAAITREVDVKVWDHLAYQSSFRSSHGASLDIVEAPKIAGYYETVRIG
jgi:hypothetical protein